VVPTARGKPVLSSNLLNNIADLSIEQEDDFSSDCEDDSDDNFCEWDIKSGLFAFVVIVYCDGTCVREVMDIIASGGWKYCCMGG
jgi:hypothetical protein